MKNYILGLMNENFEYGISKNVVSRTSINCEGNRTWSTGYWLLVTGEL